MKLKVNTNFWQEFHFHHVAFDYPSICYNNIIPGPSCSKGRHIHWTNLPDSYQLDSDLSAGLRYQMFEQLDTTYFIENF